MIVGGPEGVIHDAVGKDFVDQEAVDDDTARVAVERALRNDKRPATETSVPGVLLYLIAAVRESSPGRTRTCDKAVNSRLLYQLSYRGMWRATPPGGARVG